MASGYDESTRKVTNEDAISPATIRATMKMRLHRPTMAT